MKLSLGEIAQALGASGEFDSSEIVQGYSIDSRTIGERELFFAIRGERFDAHDFVRDVLKRGAFAVIAQARAAEFAGLRNVLIVPQADPLEALQRLGNYVRRKWGKRVIGLTGSAGKTTTKDATATVLATRFNVLKSQGNLNNHFGLPLQLLRLEPEHDVAVIEMGMNHTGEIAALCKIAEPDWAMVTNVGMAHAGNFPDGIEGVARAKFELVENTKPGGVVILNGDDERVRQFGLKYSGKVLFYGINPGADVWAERISDMGALGSEFEIGCSRTIECFDTSTAHAKLPLIGRHNLLNALAAVAAGMASEVPLPTCTAAIGTLSPGDKRGEVLHVVLPCGRGSATLINDCYNSNPKALKAMIDALAKVPAERRIAIVGEMLELGEQAAELHRECGRFIAAERIDLTIGVRGHAEELVAGVHEGEAQAEFVATPQEAGEWMRQNLRDGDAVLLKASRGVRLEDALEVLASNGDFQVSHS